MLTGVEDPKEVRVVGVGTLPGARQQVADVEELPGLSPWIRR